MDPPDELEVDLLLEALVRRFGYDFRAYERGAVTDKLRALMAERQLATVSLLQDRVLHDGGTAACLLRALSVQPTPLFCDMEQTGALRQVLASCLRASAVPKVWLAECAGAEEAWSLVILLVEQGLDARTEIFATVANEEVLAEVRDASIPPARLAMCAEQYAAHGGAAALQDYFDIDGEHAVLKESLRRRITWAQYNLVTDASFNEFQMIVCSRALADFGPVLRGRVLRLFHDSLALFGVLGLDREFDAGDPLAALYQPVVAQKGWYKRIG
ncbi:MAG: CheR family methyltransferase [Gammaproteobacteria bacterium]